MSPSRPAPGPIALVVVALVLCLATPAVAAPTIVARYDFFRGLEVAQVVLPEAETTRFLLVLPAGGADDPAGMEGLASVTASMLLLGSRSDAEREKTLELYGRTTGLELQTVGGNVALGFSSVHPWINDALETLGRTLAEPHWSPEGLRARVEERSAAMTEGEQDPSALAWRAWKSTALGGHPAAGSGLWTAEGLASLRTGDLRHFHRHFFRPDGAVLLVAGPESVGRMRYWISSELLGSSWSGARDPAPPVPELPTGGPELTLVHYPGLQQAQLVVGEVGPAVEPADQAGLDVLAGVLAGDLSSRLNRRLRGELQLTYGASPWRLVRDDLSVLAVGASVVHDDAARALREILDELDLLATSSPPTSAEVSVARQQLRTGYQHALVSPGGTVDLMAMLLVRGWPPEDLAGWMAQVEGTEQQTVAELAAESLGDGQRRIVVVGDADRLEGPLGELGLSMGVVRGR